MVVVCRSRELLILMPPRKQTKKRNRKAKPGTKGLALAECRLEAMDRPTADLVSAVEQNGGVWSEPIKSRLVRTPFCWPFYPSMPWPPRYSCATFSLGICHSVAVALFPR